MTNTANPVKEPPWESMLPPLQPDQSNQIIQLAVKYPKYYRDVRHLKFMDVYKVHDIFQIDDPSGRIQHASKKLLLSGSRTGGKSALDDIKEAHDTLRNFLIDHGVEGI